MIPAPETDLPQLARTRAERAAGTVLPAGGMVWTATQIMHMTGLVPFSDILVGTVVLTAVSWGAAARNGRIPSSVPWWLAVAGGWVGAGDILGPLAWWPAPMLTAAWIVYTLAASRYAHRHESVVSAREWRAAKADWLGRSHDWHLGGSHLLDFEQTRLGELYTVSTKGTGKRASHLVGHALEEVIAEAEDLAVSRVRVMGHRLAGRIRISVRRIDPWADVLLHPLVCDDHEIELPAVRSIMDPAVIGQDPETGEPLAVPLYDEAGGKNVSITGIKGAGKGVVLDDLAEHVTACDDALMIRLNLSIKGYAEAESWGPSCWLTAFGPEQKSRAAAVLQIAGRVIEWRARTYKRGQYVPSPADPALVFFLDENDSAVEVAAVRAGINMLATKGREYGVSKIQAGQRNTREYNDPKARSQDDVYLTGAVRNAGEARKAGAGDAAGPDMAAYGEGRPGVWKVERLGGGRAVGRSYVFSASPAAHGAAVERIAQERAYGQPELPADCRAYLGEAYDTLRASEVFEKWAHDRGEGAYLDEPEAPDDASGDAPPLPAQEPGDGTAAAVPAGGKRTVLAEKDPFETWLEMDVDEGTQAKINSIHEKLGGARKILEEAAARPKPGEVPPGVLEAHAAERWKRVDEGTELSPEHREKLLGLLAGGTTSAAAGKALGVSSWTALTYLRKLRGEGVAQLDGKGRAARWHRAVPGNGDGQ